MWLLGLLQLGGMAGIAVPARAQDQRANTVQAACQPVLERTLTAYNAQITTRPKAESIEPGQLVEFNPNSLRDPVPYMRGIGRKRAFPEWYWVGANCEKGPDCDELRADQVPMGSTGTKEWNESEFRIDDLAHPAVVKRAKREMEKALRAAAAAGTDLVFRIDNMHDLDDKRFYDRRHVRPYEQLFAMAEAWRQTVTRVTESGLLRPDQLVGLTAHNNFPFWKRLIDEGGEPPLLLRLENPTQFRNELANGLALMRARNIPFIAVEFEKGHLYRPDMAQIELIAKQVSILDLMKDEDNYASGVQRFGAGPKIMSNRRPGVAACK